MIDFDFDQLAKERPLARADDPATSKAAAIRAKAFKWNHADLIYGVLWRPMIAPEIAAKEPTITPCASTTCLTMPPV